MKKILNLFTATLVCLALTQTNILASSHREAPLIAYDPLADNTDVYAFRSPCDTNNVVLIANFIPFERPQDGPNYNTFGANIRYEIHVDNDAATAGDAFTYRFTFQQVNEDTTTFFNIRLGRQNLKTTYTLERLVNGGAPTVIISNGVVPPNNIGPRSIENATVGLGLPYDTLMQRAVTIASTGEKVFAGPADDPFFVDLGGAFDVGNFRIPGRDGLAKFNVHSLVIEAPISTFHKEGKTTSQAVNILDSSFIIGVYASASRQQITTFDSTTGKESGSGAWIQVSRLGMPLTNEVIIPIGQKDKWNATAVNAEGEFIPYFQNPELALYMDDSQFGPAVPGLAKLRIQSNSLGTFDFRNKQPGLFPLKGTPDLDGTALAEAAFGSILLPNDSTPRSVDLLPIFYTGVPNLRPYQLATGKYGNPLAAGKPFINNFFPTLGDMLRLNMAVPVTPRNDAKFSSLGLVQAAVLGITDTAYNNSLALEFIPNMDGFPNGRRLEDDVTTIELQAVGGIVLAALGLWYDDYNGAVTITPQLINTIVFHAGVTQNDTSFKPCFPYVQTPWRAFVGTEYVGPVVFDPLPVTFTDFTANKSGETVRLQWQVTNEINNDYYEVEQSLGGGVWVKVGTVKAKSGSTNNYQLIHSTPILNKTNFYRIKQVDKDGRFAYSVIRLVKFTSTGILTLSPNPATNFIKIYSTRSPLNIVMYDLNGKKVLSQRLTDGTAQVNIAGFSKGIYTIVAIDNGIIIETSKILKK